MHKQHTQTDRESTDSRPYRINKRDLINTRRIQTKQPTYEEEKKTRGMMMVTMIRQKEEVDDQSIGGEARSISRSLAHSKDVSNTTIYPWAGVQTMNSTRRDATGKTSNSAKHLRVIDLGMAEKAFRPSATKKKTRCSMPRGLNNNRTTRHNKYK